MEKRESRLFLLAVVGITSVALCHPGSAAVSLQLKLPKGKTYYQRTVVDQHITQTIMNQPQVVDISVGIGMKLDVLDVDSAGNMQIRYTFIWCMSKQTTPMATVSYDSAQQATAPAGAEPLAALLNQSYVMKLSPRGEVLDVQGVEQMKEAVQKKMPAGAEGSPMGNVANQFLDKQGLKETTENLLAIYPDKPVEPGASWSEKKTLTAGFERTEESKYTLQKQEAGIAIIGIASTIRANPEAAPRETQGMKMQIDLSGPGEGTIRMVEATGLIQIAQGRGQLKGEIKVGDSGQGQPMMAIPMTIDTNTKVEMSEKMWETVPSATK
jgi:hypothetical protein